ncbi:1-acyl-sn-glycerol-3-phosphate acyltransferase [Helicobacter aurati]|uniref:1-acyl-sn-glycerol-3-phosphate acyltransferase n=2 Tax=Helicobacter aurati TaxID=137778 RepID=A0A3D8J8J6_9HELI|nr:1-acyl-sn-glycerol-3-phosphate acyltransferase [Helicobacter aurati]
MLCRLHKIQGIQNLCRDLVHYSWKFFLYLCQSLKILHYELRNFENLIGKPRIGDSRIIIANHPSLLDVVLLLATIRRVNCIVKNDLRKNIFLFAAIATSGYIANGNQEKLLEQSIKVLANGESLLIFPEGTRTQEQIIFHKAASYIAIASAKKLTPIFIKMQPKSLQKDSKWYNTAKNIHYQLIANNDIFLQDFYSDMTNPLRVRKLHNYLTQLYQKEFL